MSTLGRGGTVAIGSRKYLTWSTATALVGVAMALGLLAVAFAGQSAPSPPSLVARPAASPPLREIPAHADASTSSPPGRQRRTGIADRVSGRVLTASPPVSVTIPRLHVSSRLELLGQDAGGVMEVPQDPALAGWYTLGPTPGALGPAVIAGHVTWNRNPAVFFRLTELRPGDLIRVARVDGRVAVFEVKRTERYYKARFPTSLVFGAVDHAALRLITCGGQYDSAAHRYRDNIVVYARLISA